MKCGLYKHKKEIPTNWVSEVNGNKYPKQEYINHGYGGIYKDLKIYL